MTQMPLDPTAVVFVAAIIPLIGAGVAALGSWLGGRAKSKQHQRQISHAERMAQMQLAAYNQWANQEAARRERFLAGRRAAIGQMGGMMGMDPGRVALYQGLVGQGMAPIAGPPAIGAGAQAVLPTPAPFDTSAVLAGALGPSGADADLPWYHGGQRGLPNWLGGPSAPAAAVGTGTGTGAGN